METHDSFIPAIFECCGRWCETCTFTAPYRVFADLAERARGRDGAEEQVARLVHDAYARFECVVLPQHKEIRARAFAYFLWVGEWLRERGREEPRDPVHPLSPISWFATLNAATISRALAELPESSSEASGGSPPRCGGPAKAALVGIERSLAAWRDLVRRGEVSERTANACTGELEWLQAALERAVPHARRLVRPGVDEQAPSALERVDAR